MVNHHIGGRLVEQDHSDHLTRPAAGALYVVATPIGNLEDISPRALQTLRDADRVAAEDTRTTGMLLKQYTIKKPLTSYFEHNERARTPQLIQEMLQGSRIALVTDAGTPAISDPGFRLVSAARAAGIPVIPIPGPCAAIAALSVSGLPVHRFAFEGFPPPRAGKRRTFLKKLATEERTLLFYESPHRIAACLQDILLIFGDRPAFLARELTKRHEECLQAPLSILLERCSRPDRPMKGEITLVVAGAPGPAKRRL